eukprot:SAG31_NODE_3316_length_4425_cov_3.196024_3_plen_80_part_00
MVSCWMLWPADFDADWDSERYGGYVERKALFTAMRACEAAGVHSVFPHRAQLYEHITSKVSFSRIQTPSHLHVEFGAMP